MGDEAGRQRDQHGLDGDAEARHRDEPGRGERIRERAQRDGTARAAPQREQRAEQSTEQNDDRRGARQEQHRSAQRAGEGTLLGVVAEREVARRERERGDPVGQPLHARPRDVTGMFRREGKPATRVLGLTPERVGRLLEARPRRLARRAQRRDRVLHVRAKDPRDRPLAQAPVSLGHRRLWPRRRHPIPDVGRLCLAAGRQQEREQPPEEPQGGDAAQRASSCVSTHCHVDAPRSAAFRHLRSYGRDERRGDRLTPRPGPGGSVARPRHRWHRRGAGGRRRRRRPRGAPRRPRRASCA